MVAALPPIPDGTCNSDIANDMVNDMLSTAAELAPRSERPHRVCARGPAWRLRLTEYDNRERRRGGTYAQNPAHFPP